MTERPILFSGPMVLAILEGRKTQTRRIVQPMSGRQREWLTRSLLDSVPHGEMSGDGWQMHHPLAGTIYQGVHVEHDSPLGWIRSPFGVRGDRLWVRETWASADLMYRDHESDGPPGVIAYAADKSAIQYEARRPRPIPSWDIESWNWGSLTWRPSIHLPRWASRLTLEITDVRVERLQDMVDPRDEGVGCPTHDGPGTFCLSHSEAVCADHRTAFASLWDCINGKGFV